jgi:hypothetical protein
MPERIRRDWCDSKAVNRLSAVDERLYSRLHMKADDYGLYDADPKRLRPALFPLLLDEVREADVQRGLAACEEAGLIRRYEVAGKALLQILRFGQRLKEYKGRLPKPKYPPPPWDYVAAACRDPAELPGTSGNFREVPGTSSRIAHAQPKAHCAGAAGGDAGPPKTHEAFESIVRDFGLEVNLGPRQRAELNQCLNVFGELAVREAIGAARKAKANRPVEWASSRLNRRAGEITGDRQASRSRSAAGVREDN